MHYLFWYLRLNLSFTLYRARYQALIDALTAVCGSAFRNEFSVQVCGVDPCR